MTLRSSSALSFVPENCCDSLREYSGVRMIRISFFSAAVVILMSFSPTLSSAYAAAPEEQREGVRRDARGAAGNQMGAAAMSKPFWFAWWAGQCPDFQVATRPGDSLREFPLTQLTSSLV
jgi:hypothetical protein